MPKTKKITQKQKKFVDEVVLKNKTMTEAYQVAYNSKTTNIPTVHNEAGKTMRHPLVQEYKAKLEKSVTDHVLSGLIERSLYDVSLYADIVTGKKDLKSLTKAQRAPIKNFKPNELGGFTLEFFDSHKILKDLGINEGMFTQKIENTHTHQLADTLRQAEDRLKKANIIDVETEPT